MQWLEDSDRWVGLSKVRDGVLHEKWGRLVPSIPTSHKRNVLFTSL